MTAQEIIEKLELSPHPEGGYYRQTWMQSGPDRALATCIYFLLTDQQRSHWHKVDAAELWLFHAGDPLTLWISETDVGPAEAITLGTNILNGAQGQGLVPKDWWQSAQTTGAYSLVSCVVSPGFQFDGFELAAPDFDIPKD
ncbi:MAG: cupin domain-containing protein [Pseudomonadota bacterium]